VDRYRIAAVFTRDVWGPILCALERRPADERPVANLLAASEGPTLRPVDWPFRPAFATPVAPAPAPARVTVAVPPPAGRLASAYAVNPERWITPLPAPITFAIGDPEHPSAPLFQATLDPTHEPGDRRWVDAVVDLAPFAGETLTLELATTSPAAPTDAGD